MKIRSLASLLALTIAVVPWSPAFAGSCDDLEAEVGRALAQSDTAKLKTLYGRAKSGAAACSSTYVYCLGRRVARAYVDGFYRRAGAGADLDTLKQFLREGASHGTVWQLSFAFAEVEEASDATDKARYDRSAAHYQDAVNDIKNIEQWGAVCPGETELLPSVDQARLILRRQSTASLLSKRLVTPPKLRNGELGGIFVGSLRGVTPKSRPIPINFEFGEAVLDAKGDAAVEVLLSFLKRKKYDNVYLSGHTDIVGNDKRNCDLAARRLGTVTARLEAGGYRGRVHIRPFGEYVPFEADDPERYSDDERRALDRRVELQLERSVMRKWGRPCGS